MPTRSFILRSRLPSMWMVLLAIALGTVTAIGVAWSGIGVRNGPPPRETSWYGPRGHQWLLRIWPGATVDVGVVSLIGIPAANPPLTGADFRGKFLNSLPHEPWRNMIDRSASQAVSGSFWELRAFGWPYKCMAAGSLYSPNGAKPVGLNWLEVKSPASGHRVSLPSYPIWPGLIANAGFFAALWLFLAFVSATVLRFVLRARRRRRGRCPMCGYDLRGDWASGCPECGWARAPTQPA